MAFWNWAEAAPGYTTDVVPTQRLGQVWRRAVFPEG